MIRIFKLKSSNTSGLLLSMFTIAQMAPLPAMIQKVRAATLEEVVVTARKREESLQDVPVSVQAYDGGEIAAQGIVDIQSMAGSIPNFSYSQAVGAGDVLIMRGLGTVGSGPHLEQAVGQVFNGYFTTRARLGRAALLDVGQVELLRGPQGPIIGKNTSLGAVVVTPNKPSEEAELKISGGYEFEGSEGYDITAIASGPLSDGVSGRLVLDYKDKDGWTKNAPTGDNQRTKDDVTIRGILNFDITENFSAELLYQYSDYDREGKPREYKCLQDGWTGLTTSDHPFGAFDNNDCGINDRNNSLAVVSLAAHQRSADFADDGVVNGSTLGTQTEDIIRDEGFQLESDLAGLTLTWDVGDVTVVSVTNYTDYTMFDIFDSDLTDYIPDPNNTTDFAIGQGNRVIFNNEEYEQFTQEIRASAYGERFDWIAGVNYFDSSLDFEQDFDHQSGAGRFCNGLSTGDCTLPFSRRHEVASVDSESISIFAQADWHLTETLDLTTGIRYTQEERDGFKDQWQSIYGTNTRDDTLCPQPRVSETAPGSGVFVEGAPNAGLSGLFGCFIDNPNSTADESAPLTGEVDEDATSWNVALRWKYNDSSMLYVSAATGFKSSGFNIRGNSNRAAGQANFVFDEEESMNIEFGGKHELLDGAMRFNWTVYHTNIDGLQLSSNDPSNISQSVVNGEATATGLEWDLLWAATDNWTIGLNGAITDTTYDEFLGACWTRDPNGFRTRPSGLGGPGGGPFTVGYQTVEAGCNVDAVDANGVRASDPAYAGPDAIGEFQDLEGEDLPFAPTFTIALTADYKAPVTDSLELNVRFKVYTVDDQALSVTNEPEAQEDGYTKVDLTVGLADIDGKWRLSLVGKNLTDETVRNWAEPSSTVDDYGYGVYSFTDESRSFAIRGEYHF